LREPGTKGGRSRVETSGNEFEKLDWKRVGQRIDKGLEGSHDGARRDIYEIYSINSCYILELC